MSKIKVLAGDLDHGSWSFSLGSMAKGSTALNTWKSECYTFKRDIESVESLDEEKVKKLAGTALWGVAGAALLGPLGAVGGMLIGGNTKEVSFAGRLKDGRTFLATTDAKTWKKIMAAMF